MKRTAILIIPEADMVGLLTGQLVVGTGTIPEGATLVQAAYTPGKGVKVWFEGENLPEQAEGATTPLLKPLTVKPFSAYLPESFLKDEGDPEKPVKGRKG